MAKKSNSQVGTTSFMRPRRPEVSLQIAKDAVDGKTPNLDQGEVSKTDHRAMDGNIPFIYDPVTVQMASERGFTVASIGHSKGWKAPKDFPKKFGEAPEGVKMGAPRLQHLKDVRKHVIDGALVELDKIEFIVAMTGKDGIAAPFCIAASKTGNYGHNCRALKIESYAEMRTESGAKVNKTDFERIVGRINNAPMLVDAEDGNQVAVQANQRIEWGHLVKGDKALTPTQVRALTDMKGVTFKPLAERWIGKGILPKDLWVAVKRQMSLAATKDEDGKTDLDRFNDRPIRSPEGKQADKDPAINSWDNVSTMTRCVPRKLSCFGFRYALVGQAICITHGVDGAEAFMILGGLTTEGLRKSKWDAKKESAPEVVVSAAQPAKPSEKKAEKTAKPKSKSKKGKGGKKKDVEPTPAEVPAPDPVVADIPAPLADPTEGLEDDDDDDDIVDQEAMDAAMADVTGSED